MDRLLKRKKKFINSSENMIKLEQDIQNNNESETELNNQLHSLTDDLKKELGFSIVDELKEKNDSPNLIENELINDNNYSDEEIKKLILDLNCEKDKYLNIVLSGDNDVATSIAVLIKSLILNCTNYKKLKIFLVCENPYYLDFNINFICKNLSIDDEFNNRINITVNSLINYIVPTEDLLLKIENTKSFHSRQLNFKPTSSFNFIRFYFDKLLPNDVNRFIYLDSDMIVKGDIENIFNLFEKKYIVGVVFPTVPYKLDSRDWVINNRYRKSLPKDHLFNAGMYIVNLKSWKYFNYSEKCIELIKKNKENKIYEGGTQSVMNIVCKNFQEIDTSWNQTGLSEGKLYDYDLTNCVEKANIIHFTGFFKPWLEKAKGNIQLNFLEEWYIYLSDLNPRYLNYNPNITDILTTIIQKRSKNFVRLYNNFKLKLKYHLICAAEDKLTLAVEKKNEISEINQVVEDGKLVIKIQFNDCKNMDEVPKYLSVNVNDSLDKFEVRTSDGIDGIYEIDLNISIDKSSIKAKFNKKRKTVTIIALIKNENNLLVNV